MRINSPATRAKRAVMNKFFPFMIIKTFAKLGIVIQYNNRAAIIVCLPPKHICPSHRPKDYICAAERKRGVSGKDSPLH